MSDKKRIAELEAKLAAATAREEFAVLHTGYSGGLRGDERISDAKYNDFETAQVYASRFGGRVQRRTVGAWAPASNHIAATLRAVMSGWRSGDKKAGAE